MSQRGTIAHEHHDLREAMQAAEQALSELEERRGKVTTQPVHGERWSSSPRETESGPRTRTFLTTPLRMAWDALTTALLAHVEHEELVLPALVERLTLGVADADEVRATMEPLFAEHERLHELLSDLRRASLGIDPVRQEMDRVVTTLLHHTEEEDTRVFPLLYGRVGLRMPTQRVHQRYSVEAAITRALRASLPEREEEAPPSFFERVRTLFSRQ